MGGFPEGWAPGEHYPDKWARRFAIDFVGGDLKAAAPKGIEPVITLSSGEAKQIEILYVEPFDGYRIQFDWYPTSDSTAPGGYAYVPALPGGGYQRNLAVSVFPARAG
ncbi:glucan biosynthesis protein D [Salmonella enterica subsp. enterica serovar Daytona]|uniref:Glucan biosynthesis protein D n=1 Tax=Salmonella enterica subsp. enterica serovar Daytona TaxID=1962639 RepID=A0A447JIU9_SALET|nr:glucan biosynthesis protein D [Salmonella enterica subsp. enterica serovar Daytona]